MKRHLHKNNEEDKWQGFGSLQPRGRDGTFQKGALNTQGGLRKNFLDASGDQGHREALQGEISKFPSCLLCCYAAL